jgi:UDP-N-acetylmuramoylalanine--D-glutamate ligase
LRGQVKHRGFWAKSWPAAILQRCCDLVLLTGSGTDELLPALEAEARAQNRPNPLRGTFDTFPAAMDAAVALARPGDTLLFSPGFTSFGMLLNEFDRGDQFVAYVERLKG